MTAPDKAALAPDVVEEVARAAQSASVGKPFRWENVALAIAPIIARLVAEEREACAQVAYADNDCGGSDVCRSARLKDNSCLLSMSGECRRDQSEEVAAAIRARGASDE